MAKGKEKKAAPSGKDTSAIDAAIREIKTKFGDEAIMKLGDTAKVNVDAIPSGSIGLDWALGGAIRYHFVEDAGQAPRLARRQRAGPRIRVNNAFAPRPAIEGTQRGEAAAD